MNQLLKSRPALPQRLRAARIDAGISQGKAADLVGYTREHLNRFECDPDRYSPELAYKLARALGVKVSADELFADAEDGP